MDLRAGGILKDALFWGMGLLALAGCATAPLGPPPVGSYTNVRESPETGDFDGVHLDILRLGDAPQVWFALCEGGCPDPEPIAARLEGDTLAFEVVEELTSNTGERSTLRYRVRVKARRTVFGPSIVVNLPDQPRSGWATLRRVKRR